GQFPTTELRPPLSSRSIQRKTGPASLYDRRAALACQPQHLISRRIGLLHDAGEGTTPAFKYNEVPSHANPAGTSPRPQSDQALNFGRLVRGIEVEMKPPPAPWTPIATLE